LLESISRSKRLEFVGRELIAADSLRLRIVSLHQVVMARDHPQTVSDNGESNGPQLIAANGLRIDRDALPFYRGVPIILRAQKPKDYSETPTTLGEHLKKRRRELGLLQREAAERMGIFKETYVNWERGHTKPVAPHFRPVVAFLGYDPSPAPTTLAERLGAKRRTIGLTFEEVAAHLGWDPRTLTRYLNGTWRMPPNRALALEAFLVAAADPAPIHGLPRRRYAARACRAIGRRHGGNIVHGVQLPDGLNSLLALLINGGLLCIL
jgi:transcriptional regulator with XRE-family HTH domain